MKKIIFLDYLYNLINHINMYKYYIKHKIYNHYYKFIESKLNITKRKIRLIFQNYCLKNYTASIKI